MSGLPSQKNYFELFGLPASFQVDDDLIARRYRELQRVVHPDRFVNAGDRERRMAMEQAAQINAAYQTLRSPMHRARYLLELNGVAFSDEHQTTHDPAFLMEQMEIREALSEIDAQADPLAVLQRIIHQLAQQQRQLETQLAEELGKKDWMEAKAIVHKLQFFARLLKECEDKELTLSDTA